MRTDSGKDSVRFVLGLVSYRGGAKGVLRIAASRFSLLRTCAMTVNDPVSPSILQIKRPLDAKRVGLNRGLNWQLQ